MSTVKVSEAKFQAKALAAKLTESHRDEAHARIFC